MLSSLQTFSGQQTKHKLSLFRHLFRILSAGNPAAYRLPCRLHLILPQFVRRIPGPVSLIPPLIREGIVLLQIFPQEIRTLLRPDGIGVAAVIRKILLKDDPDLLIIIIHIQESISKGRDDSFHIIEHLLVL